MAKSVKDYMTQVPVVVDLNASLTKAQKMMHEGELRHLPVIHSGRLVGVISDRDLKLVAMSPDVEKYKVSDVMTSDPYAVYPETPLSEVVSEMVSRRIGSAVVQDEIGNIVGVFTVSDGLVILKHYIDCVEASNMKESIWTYVFERTCR